MWSKFAILSDSTRRTLNKKTKRWKLFSRQQFKWRNELQELPSSKETLKLLRRQTSKKKTNKRRSSFNRRRLRNLRWKLQRWNLNSKILSKRTMIWTSSLKRNESLRCFQWSRRIINLKEFHSNQWESPSLSQNLKRRHKNKSNKKFRRTHFIKKSWVRENKS